MDNSKINAEAIAALFREKQYKEGLTLEEAAHRANIPPRSLTRVIHGHVRPSDPVMERLIRYLELSEGEVPTISSEKPSNKGKHVFISYSHKDKEYLDRLLIHLKPLEKQGLIDPWTDTRLLAGDRWKQEIDTALKRSRVAILLVSADFLASDFIVENELPPLLHSAEEKGTLIIPVILKPCRFARDKSLSDFQAINSPDEPLSLIDENEKENIYDTVAQRIEQAFETS